MDFLENYDKIKQGKITEEEAKVFKKAEKDLVNMFQNALRKPEPEQTSPEPSEQEDQEATVISGPVSMPPSDFQIHEEKELTYAQNMRYQRQFLRFLVSKLHTVNSMTDNVNSIKIPENFQMRPKEQDSDQKMMEQDSGLAQHRYFSDQRQELTYQQLYQQVSMKLHMILHQTKVHLSEISQAKSADIAFAQLQQTPRMQEVCMMLIAALEKLFQAIEYIQFPVKEDLARRMDLQYAENLGLNQINEEIKKLREVMMTDTFYNL